MAISKAEKHNICLEFGKNPNDTGSSQVQVVILTKEIVSLTDHCQKNPKDFSTRRGLLQKVSDRHKHLQYLQRTDVSKYKEIVTKLGLRKYISE
jgi:small subunit ribosomal protein S15